jgi:Zn-dependent M16 (insulinase) family peptidase
VEDLRKLAGEPNSFWIDLLTKYFGDKAPCVLIKGKPSIDLQVKMSEEEEERVKQQCAKLGEDGLKKKGDELMVAIEHNDVRNCNTFSGQIRIAYFFRILPQKRC